MVEKKDYTPGAEQSSGLLVAVASVIAAGLGVLVARTVRDRRTLVEAAVQNAGEKA